MKVMKFGGSSIQGAARIREAVQIVLEESLHGSIAVVTSAMQGITDTLITAAREAAAGTTAYAESARRIRSAHEEAIEGLFGARPVDLRSIHSKVEPLMEEMGEILQGIALVQECSPRSLDLIMSFGERIAGLIFADYLTVCGADAVFVDARSMILTDNDHGSAEVDFDATNARIRNGLPGLAGIPVVTGFIAAAGDGATTTLGRHGSDYTAAIFGAAMGAEVIEIWTDVDGILSADPRYVESAFVIPELSFREAMELSYFGAEVIHPNTMIPAVRENIPIRIKNTFRPEFLGTLISSTAKPHGREITGIASIKNAALINVEGGGLIGVRGIASRVFRAFADVDVNVVMISQASSEHSICLGCRETEAHQAVASLNHEFARETAAGRIEGFQLLTDLEIVAIVGDRMRGTPGISGKLFSALGAEGINVLAVAQGSSERNISFVISRTDGRRALTSVHRAFLEEPAP